jgi:hypothetical protein
MALASSGCAHAPSAPRADVQAVYGSKYFEVEAPRGEDWTVRVRSPTLPFPYEPSLFEPWVTVRIGFSRRGWAPDAPRGESREPTLEFLAGPLDAKAAPAEGEELTLAGRTWRALPVDDDGLFRRLELASAASPAPLSFTIRLCVPHAIPGLVPPELAQVIAGFRTRPVPADAAPEIEIERGVEALYDLASDFAFTGAAADPALREVARRGINELRALHPERYEGPLFAAGLAILAARSTVVYGGEAVGPFDYAYQGDDGRVATTAARGHYDTAGVVSDTRAALARQPDSFWSRYYLAAALQRRGELPAAAEELGRLTRAHPESALAWFALALVRRDAGNRSAALEAAQRASEANERQRVFAKFGGGLFLGRTSVDRLIRELRGE